MDPQVCGFEWKLYRYIISRVFTPASLEGMMSSMMQIASTLVKTMSMNCERYDKTGERLTMDMDFNFQMYTIDVLGRTILGKDFKCCETLKRDENIDAMYFLSTEFIRMIGSPFNLAARFYNIPTRANREHAKAQKRVRNFIKEIIKEHRTSSNNANILSALLDLGNLQTQQKDCKSVSPQGMINEDIFDNVLTLYRVGFLTTASMLTYSIYRIAIHPEVEANCLEEARRILGENLEKVSLIITCYQQYFY